MSRIHYQDVTLEDLISRSDLVLVVKAAQPPNRKIPVRLPKAPAKLDKEAPVFVRILQRYEVLESLKPGVSDLIGKKIEVDGANWEQRFEMHKRYYLDGVSKSPIYEQYRPEEPLGNDLQYIVFLQRTGQNGYAFVVNDALEKLAARSRIEVLLSKRP